VALGEYYDFDEVCKQDVRTSRYTSAEDYLSSREKSSPKLLKLLS
jgi:hypothetical protein